MNSGSPSSSSNRLLEFRLPIQPHFIASLDVSRVTVPVPAGTTNKQRKNILLIYLVVYSQIPQLWLYLNISSFISRSEQEHEFLAMQRVEFEKFCKELIDLHRERMYNLEMQFLQDKHSLKRGLYAPLMSTVNPL